MNSLTYLGHKETVEDVFQLADTNFRSFNFSGKCCCVLFIWMVCRGNM